MPGWAGYTIATSGAKVFACGELPYGHQHLEEQLGEGSIALHRALGHETIINGKLIDEAIDEGVITIVFPASGIENDPPKIRHSPVSRQNRNTVVILSSP